MTTSREHVARVRELISQEPGVEGDKPSVSGWLQRTCRAAERELSAMGVGISLLSKGGDPITVAASSQASALVEELQFTLGEGPCIDAFASRRPVLVPDLTTAATTWPGYAPAVAEHGVRSVFAFPLQVGAARLGAMDVYRDRAGSMSAEVLLHALIFAEVAMVGLLDAASGTTQAAADLIDDADDNRLEVYQAQGMVAMQLGVTAEAAMARLRAYAYSHNRRLIDVAHEVITRRLQLESDA